jgi:2-polyprenyl-3-methyl-5-hydroxy-6-metoxy-1,4-benzoquinol methylase
MSNEPLFVKNGDHYVRCRSCGLVYLSPQPTPEQLQAIYDEHYYEAWSGGFAEQNVARLKKLTFRVALGQLSLLAGVRRGALLDVGCASGFLLEVARERGFDPWGIEISPKACQAAKASFGADRIHCGTTDDCPFPPASFDVVVMSDLLEHVPDPRRLLAWTHGALRPGAVVMVIAPNVAALSSRVMGSGWTDYKREHLYYFAPSTIRALFSACGFEPIRVAPFPKFLDFAYIDRQLARFHTPVFSTLSRVLSRIVPPGLARVPVPMLAGSMVALARRTSP